MSGEYLLFFSKFCRHSQRAMEMLSTSKMRLITMPICIDDKKAQLPSFVTVVPLLFSTKTKTKHIGESLFYVMQKNNNVQQDNNEQGSNLVAAHSTPCARVPAGDNYFSWQDNTASTDLDAENSLNQMFNPNLVGKSSPPEIQNMHNQFDRPQPIQASKEEKGKEVEDAFDRLIMARNQERMQSMIRR